MLSGEVNPTSIDSETGFGLEALAQGGPGAGMALVLSAQSVPERTRWSRIPLLLEPMAEQPSIPLRPGDGCMKDHRNVLLDGRRCSRGPAPSGSLGYGLGKVDLATEDGIVFHSETERANVAFYNASRA